MSTTAIIVLVYLLGVVAATVSMIIDTDATTKEKLVKLWDGVKTDKKVRTIIISGLIMSWLTVAVSIAAGNLQGKIK